MLIIEIAYGSQATIKNSGRGGALLHSHIQRYPDGSEQQQITCYAHKDSNNDWIFAYPWGTPEPENKSEIHYIKDGDVVRLS